MPSNVTNSPPTSSEGTSGSGGIGELARVLSASADRVPRSMRTLVTGGAGFIGSNPVGAPIAPGGPGPGVDNISTGRRAHPTRAPADGPGAARGRNPRSG